MLAEHKLQDTQKAMLGVESRFIRVDAHFGVCRLESLSGRENSSFLLGQLLLRMVLEMG